MTQGVSESVKRGISASAAARGLALSLFASAVLPSVISAATWVARFFAMDWDALGMNVAAGVHVAFACLAALFASAFARDLVAGRASLLRVATLAYSAMGAAILLRRLMGSDAAMPAIVGAIVDVLLLVAIARAIAHASVRAYQAGRVAMTLAALGLFASQLSSGDALSTAVIALVLAGALNVAAWIAALVGLWLASIDLRAKSSPKSS